MLPVETLQQLQDDSALSQVCSVLNDAGLHGDVIAAPSRFNIVDLEKYLPIRRRMRGAMSTNHPEHFFRFCAAVSESEGKSAATCFVDPKKMSAAMIFNLGDDEMPGHADHTATLTLEQTAAFKSLKAITAKVRSQKEIAEWMEDWRENLSASDANGDAKPMLQAINAVRSIDIKAVRNVGSEVQNLSATRSTLEKISAESEHKLPAEIVFTCEPYQGLTARPFSLRLSALTGGDALSLSLQIRRAEAIEQEMADEFAQLCESSIKDVPVYVGTYDAK